MCAAAAIQKPEIQSNIKTENSNSWDVDQQAPHFGGCKDGYCFAQLPEADFFSFDHSGEFCPASICDRHWLSMIAARDFLVLRGVGAVHAVGWYECQIVGREAVSCFFDCILV